MRKLIFALVFGVVLIPNYGFTLGMGEIEVNSALNQQLDARIELISAAPEDAESLIVKLATREEFNRAGLDRPFTLSELKFSAYTENGQVFIKVSTAKPVREPFLNFLIEIDWPKGHLLREFTILLDPPVYMGQTETAQASDQSESRPALSGATTAAPATVQSSGRADGFRPAVAPVAAPVAAPVSGQTSSRPAVAAPVPVATQQRSSYTPYTPSGGYRIQAGDTAWSLANRMRPDESVTVEQMMLAMLRTNPEVFINENVNGLKRGYILRMPDRNAIDAVGQAEALAAIRQQNALWREYQQTLAAGKPATAMGAEGKGSSYGSGIPSRSDARLEIVSAGSGSAASGSSKDPSKMTAAELREQLALAREAVETERVEKEALLGQVDSLEQKVNNMKGLINIEDNSMAEMQGAGEMPGETAMPEDMMPGDETITAADSEEEALQALDALTGETAPEMAEEMVDVAEGAAESEAVFVDEQAEGQMAEELAVDQLQPEEQYEYIPEPQPEPDLITSLLNNPLVVGGVAAALLVLFGLVYLLIKRRRDAAAKEVESMMAGEEGLDFESELEDIADMVDDDAVASAVSEDDAEVSMEEAEDEDEFDAEATMILPSADDTIMTPAADLQEEAEEERDDVIAEADVYLAYGIYQQAEDLLNAAIAEHPEKESYRVKLAETYFASKNADGLSKLGADMKQQLGGEKTAAWHKVVAMGKELCPDDEIFSQAGMAPEVDIDDLMPKVPEPMDFDLGEDSGELAAPDLDLDFATGVDETDLEMPSLDEDELDVPALDETAVMSAEEMPEIETAEEESDELVDLEFDLSETEAVSEPAFEPADEPEEEVEEFSLDIEASELDIEDELSPAKPEADIEAEADDFEMEADAGELDFDIGAGEETELSAVEEISEAALEDVSLDDLGAELEEMAEETPEMEMPDLEETSMESAPAAMPETSDEDEMDLSDLSDVDEISTKLDLARAYLDMGDHEGARDILDEVMADGNDQQKMEAEELIKDLG